MIKKSVFGLLFLLFFSCVPIVLQAKDLAQLTADLHEGRDLSSEDLYFVARELEEQLMQAKTNGDKDKFFELFESLELVNERLSITKRKERDARNDENRVWRSCYQKSSTDLDALEKGLLVGGFVLFALPVGIIMWKLAAEFLKLP